MNKQTDRQKHQTILLLYALLYSLYYARSVPQVKTPKCVTRKRHGDTSAATAAVDERDNLAAERRRTQRAMLRMAYQKEMPARPQSRRVKRLRGRAAETIILQGDNPFDVHGKDAVPNRYRSLREKPSTDGGRKLCAHGCASHGRATGGQRIYNVTEKTGEIVGAIVLSDTDEVVCITSQGKTLRAEADAITKQGRASSGIRVLEIEPPDMVIGVDRVVREEGE